jgi:hypothetical protein
LRGARISQDGEQALLELRGDLYFLQLGRGVHRASVGVDEGHAGAAPLDMPFEELARRFRKAPIEIIAQEVGYLPTFDRGGQRGVTL